MNKKRCPYPGLRPFNEEEAIYFKGRDLHIRQITKQLEERKIIMITGASGDGKSSLVYAGLIPNARAGFFHAEYNNWLMVDFKPERSPLHNLSQSLASHLQIEISEVESKLQYGFSSLVNIYKSSPYYIDKNSDEWINADENKRKNLRNNAKNLFILADQFEEFFTNTENYSHGNPSVNAYTTVNLLLETATIALRENLPIYIVFTMRSDFISQCVAFKGLPETIGYSQFFVPRLKRNEIKQVIEEPASLSGGKISNRLTEVLINELRDGFDQLPVLQHALNQLWELADNGEQKLDLIHLAKLAGMPSRYLSTEDKTEFNEWFNTLPEFKKKHFETPELSNILNTHANILYETAHAYFNQNVNWVKKEISLEDAKKILKVCFQSLTKIDDGRAVRNRMSLKEITRIINRDNITYDIVCGIINVFRLPDNTFIRPFINIEDLGSQYISADSILDITHEALIRNWQILKSWEEEEVNNLNDYQEFKIQLTRWTGNHKSNEFLLAQGPLNYFEKWYKHCKPNPYWIAKYDTSTRSKKEKIIDATVITEDTKAYLQKSREHLTLIEKAKKRRKNIALSTALAVIVVLSGFVAWAVKEKAYAQKQELLANEQRSEAVTQRLQAEDERNKAIIANERAEKNAKAAIASKKESDVARKISENMRSLAEEKSLLAQEEALKAQKEKTRADKQRVLAESAENNAKTLSMLATAQSMAFKAKQNFDDKQLNYISAYYAYYYNNSYGGYKRDAAIYEGLRYALETNGYSNKIYSSSKQLACLAELENNQFLFYNNDGSYYTIDATNYKNLNNGLNKYATPAHNVFYVGNYMLISSEDGTLNLLNRESQKSQSLKGHSDFVNDAIRIENYLITASRDNTIKTWDLNALNKGAISTINTNGRVNKLANNETTVYAGLQTGELITFHILKTEFETIVKLKSRLTALTTTNNLLVAGSSLGDTYIFDLQNKTQLTHKITNNQTVIEAVAIDKNSEILAIASSDKTIQLFDIYDWQKKPIIISDHNQNVQNIFFSKNNKLLANCKDNSVRIWETNCKNYADLVKKEITRMPSETEWKQIAGNNIPIPNKQ